jgi:membrane-bound serine protease (ClpP class)
MTITALILFAAAMVFFAVELMLPSGVIALCGATCLVGAVVMLFRIDTTYGLIGATVSMIALPFFLSVMLKVWPHTPIGRLMIHRGRAPAMTIPTPREQDSDEEDASEEPQVVTPRGPSLLGARGTAVTDLRPGGIALIGSKRIDVLADAGLIRAGTKVRVVAEDGMEVKVRVEEG